MMKISVIVIVWSMVAFALAIPDDELYRDLLRQAVKANKQPNPVSPALTERSEELTPPSVRGEFYKYSLKLWI